MISTIFAFILGLVVLINVSCAQEGMGTRRDRRVVGGKRGIIEQYPYQVSLELQGVHVCGGAILKSNWVITAAHCFRYSRNGYTVRAGTSTVMSDGSVHPVKDIILHDDTTQCGPHVHDVALIRLEIPISFDKYRKPVKVLTKNNPLGVGTWANVTGWGLTESEYQSVLGGLVPGQICAGFVDESVGGTCAADGGAPLVSDGTLVGISSWAKSCGSPPAPGVYTDPTHYFAWIDRTIG
ncbi:hypothetical protein QAD02_015597 [Eretmocerus hayati]|uniref:Uncharacterized protein n=1 Tax=Eretmocerus hayati TaxID=131215 RepID=A0ACC2P897_9HYME|nr:hypothetical protein QAD02_015597 [Eretmocerus hayati]